MTVNDLKLEIVALQDELNALPNVNKAKAQYKNLLSKIQERKDLPDEKITILIDDNSAVQVSLSEFLTRAIDNMETPKDVKERRKEIIKAIHNKEKEVLKVVGVRN